MIIYYSVYCVDTLVQISKQCGRGRLIVRYGNGMELNGMEEWSSTLYSALPVTVPVKYGTTGRYSTSHQIDKNIRYHNQSINQ